MTAMIFLCCPWAFLHKNRLVFMLLCSSIFAGTPRLFDAGNCNGG